MPPMLVVGSVAFDTLHLPNGSHEKVLGGSATYAALAGSIFTPAQLVGVVGRDYPDSAVKLLREHNIDLEGLESRDGLTFHWEGRYANDLTSRTSLKTELNVFAEFHPKIPERFRSAGLCRPAISHEPISRTSRSGVSAIRLVREPAGPAIAQATVPGAGALTTNGTSR